jgi:choice-of-anchor B domain-containing protein
MKAIIFSVILFIFSFHAFSQLNMSQLGHLPYSEELSDVWGYVDETGKEYALVGVFDGLSIVDISDPANPAEIYFAPGLPSIWRDIKTWGDYAYVSNESGGGVFIVDLGPLPGGDITSTASFTGNTYDFQTIHNLFIDEYGKLYIFGANNGNGGAIICDLTQDPMNPVELGRFNDFYLHDGMARGDTLWGAGLYQGVLAAIDVSDPSSPSVMGTVSTPSQFTHNAWVSDDGTHVFTTDEVSSGFIGAYNVTDLSNMFETDRIRSATGTDVIPHNVHVYNDFLVTSYYTDGIVVHDAKYPDKLIEVANFDTSPAFSGQGFSGSWGAYPFLPSGVILASDIEEGLYILDINYVRGAFLEGTVTDKNGGSQLFNVQVVVQGTELITQTTFDGSYEFGTTLSGNYNILFSKDGYQDLLVEDVSFINGEIEILNAEMEAVTVGISDRSDQFSGFSVYPNPFTSSVNLDYDLSGETGPFRLDIYNAAGLVVKQITLPSETGTLSLGNDLRSGLYILRLIAGDKLVTAQRMLKQ